VRWPAIRTGRLWAAPLVMAGIGQPEGDGRDHLHWGLVHPGDYANLWTLAAGAVLLQQGILPHEYRSIFYDLGEGCGPAGPIIDILAAGICHALLGLADLAGGIGD